MSFNGEKLLREMRGYIDSFRSAPPATHFGGTYTNRFVEATRDAPYWVGHVDCIVWPLFVILVCNELARLI
jgi:hypothetical protein